MCFISINPDEVFLKKHECDLNVSASVPFISPMSRVLPSCSSRSALAAFFLCFLPS